MPIYPDNIPRCQHIKINGVQCGSPAQKRSRFCFFHKRWHETRVPINRKPGANLRAALNLPVLEDANAIQMAIMQVMQLVLKQQVDSKTAGLLFYGLQTASTNLRQIDIEPKRPTRVVIDPAAVDERCIGEDAWDPEDFELSEEEEEEEAAADSDDEDEEDEDEEEPGPNIGDLDASAELTRWVI
jgi:hypothetical protein